MACTHLLERTRLCLSAGLIKPNEGSSVREPIFEGEGLGRCSAGCVCGIHEMFLAWGFHQECLIHLYHFSLDFNTHTCLL